MCSTYICISWVKSVSAVSITCTDIKCMHLTQMKLQDPYCTVVNMCNSNMQTDVNNNIRTDMNHNIQDKCDVSHNMQTDVSHNMQTDDSHNMQTDVSHNMQTDMSHNMQSDMNVIQTQVHTKIFFDIARFELRTLKVM